MQQWSDQRTETIIGQLLRSGVILAASVVGLGGIFYLIRHGAEPADFAHFHAEPPEYCRLWPILQGVFRLRGRSIIQLGLVLLIATPVARVAFSAVAFHLEHDRKYVVITLIVLGILIYSLAGGA
jgi:uncharacterized membrane protein